MSKHTPPPPKADIIAADYSLQKRIGSGPLDPAIIARCQKTMDETPIDFTPVARDLLASLAQTINACKTQTIKTEQTHAVFLTTIMNLKAGAGTFKYNLISDLAGIVMGLLEAINTIDDDILDILQVHQKTVTAILQERITGNGGKQGDRLKAELKDACRRYFESRK